MDYARETHPHFHFILFSKNWFSPASNIFKDEELFFDFIRKINYLDNYGSLDKWYTKYDIIANLINAVDRHNEWLSKHYPSYVMTIAKFMQRTQQLETWYKYPHNVAIVMVIKEWFAGMDGRMVVFGDVKFDRKMHKMGILNLREGETYREVNRRYKEGSKCFKDNGVKLRFLEFANKRAEESKGTDYEWKLSHRDEDVQDFIRCIESCERRLLDWHDENCWDELIDWYEALPNY